MTTKAVVCTAVVAWMLATAAVAHEGIVVGHSPPAEGTGPCPTDAPLRLFLLPDYRLGGPIEGTAHLPAQPGEPTMLARLSLGALLARPEFGGFVYVEDTPGFDFVNPDNACHAMTTAHTGGQPFTVSAKRVASPDDAHLAMADPFGVVRLTDDGDAWVFGDEEGGHSHPLWLTRRAGLYATSMRVTSDFFDASGVYSLCLTGGPDCYRAVCLVMDPLLNADVVDNGDEDDPIEFDTEGHSWLANGVYGTDRGLPMDGRIEAFQLGGALGTGLSGDRANCLFDNGDLSCAGTLDLLATAQSGVYESFELLIGAAGPIDAGDVMTVRIGYDVGLDQVVLLRRAVSTPMFFPLHDWRIEQTPMPHLSVGPNGGRTGGGFVRSTGAGVDEDAGAVFYFQRVTFPVDAEREVISVSFDDYTGHGHVGVFAMTAIAVREPSADYDGDGVVDLLDAGWLAACMTGPHATAQDPMCLPVDSDCDEDIDLLDVALFQRSIHVDAP